MDATQAAWGSVVSIDEPPKRTRRYTDFDLYRRLLRQASQYWWHMVGLLVLTALSGPLALLAPLPLKILVDSVVGTRPLPAFINNVLPAMIPRSSTANLLIAIALLLGTTLLLHIHGLITSLLRVYTGEKLALGFQSRLFQHIQHLSLSYHDSNGTSDSLYRIQYDAPSLQYVTIDGIIRSSARASRCWG
jgi:ATP-binding cassette subfamily B protein